MKLYLNDANFEELVLNHRGEIVICFGTQEALSKPDAQQRMKAFEQNEHYHEDVRSTLSENTIGIVDSTDPNSVEITARFQDKLKSWLGKKHPVEMLLYEAGRHPFTMVNYTMIRQKKWFFSERLR